MTARSCAVALAVGGLLLGSMTATAMAGHGKEPTVPAHQHYVVTPGGDEVRVGPNACERGQSTAFDHFHFNVHTGNVQNGFNQENNPVGFEATPCD
jgi:hypothetical protein